MSRDWFEDVLEFHRKFRPNLIGDTPKNPPRDTREFRIGIIAEEITETFSAMQNEDLPGVADGIVDSIYVLIGAAVTYGIDLRPVWDEVHRANMAKDGGALRDDQKVAKPPGWVPPDVAGVLGKQEPIDKVIRR